MWMTFSSPATTTTTRRTSSLWIFVASSMVVSSLLLLTRLPSVSSFSSLGIKRGTTMSRRALVAMSSSSSSSSSSSDGSTKGKVLVLGGTGFLGQMVCQRALLEGYAVSSLSRRGLPPSSDTAASSPSAVTTTTTAGKIDYRQGDARQPSSIANILNEGGYVGVIHCIGLLFDDESGLGDYNRFASGSGSIPDSESSYDAITRQTAFNAIDATMEYVKSQPTIEGGFPFIFTSAAEAGWPNMSFGDFVEERLAPDFLKRYLAAKRQVESKLLSSETTSVLRPVILRPSLIYSMDRPASFPAVGAFFIGSKIGLPFIDEPVSVQSLSKTMIRALNPKTTMPNNKSQPVQGVLRYPEINELGS